jgi:hypothetical protein
VTGLVNIDVGRILPSRADILRRQGVPPSAPVTDRVAALVEQALETFSSSAEPACVAADVSIGVFDGIFRGEGGNDDDAPLRTIYPKADHLVLFALTMGHGVSGRIADYLGGNDFAKGSMLDTAASLAVENSVGLLERLAAEECAGKGLKTEGCGVLNYSPGYCGWHLGAQKSIFRHLNPGRIGITLNDSYLMTPLKSATGVLVHGERTIHDFDNGFNFCSACSDQTCLDRMDRV